MRLQTVSLTSGGEQFLEAYCFSTDKVGDVVYIMGDRVGYHYQVTKVNVDSITNASAVGIIVGKYSATDCVVQRSGLVEDLYVGLTPQELQFIGVDSRLQHVPPAPPLTGRRIVQCIAQAMASNVLLIDVKSPIIRTAQ